MSSDGHLVIEVEIGRDGPSGTARDDAGRVTAFSGWLELIALIQSPTDASGEQAPQHDVARETTR